MRVIPANVSGVRSSIRRAGFAWLLGQQPDVLCLHAGHRVGIDDLLVEQGRWVEVDLATAAAP